MNIYIKTLICVIAMTVLIAPSCAQPASFVVNGWVFYENDTACDNPAVNITNLDTAAEWQAEAIASSNYCQIVRANGTDLNVSEILRFNATSPDGSQSRVIEHTVTQDEVNDGGIFYFNITLVSSAAPTPTLDEYTITNRTITPPQTTEIDVRFSEKVKWKIAIENGGVVHDWTGTSTTPTTKTWNGTYEENGTTVPDGVYVVNITWANTTTGLGDQNNTETITVSTSPDETPPTVSIEDVTVLAPGENITVPIMVNYVTNLGGCMINMTYNASVVHVTDVTSGDMDNLTYNINNGSGWVSANAINLTGLSENVVFAYINFTAVGCEGDTSPLNITVETLFDVGFNNIAHTVISGTFTIGAEDSESPLVTNASASMATILNDNGRARAPGTNVTVLNVTVTDSGSGVANVTIDLSSIGGSPVQPMVRIDGNDIWTVTTNATAGINLTHQLAINATDHAGNCNDTVEITLTVLRRGDVCRDDNIDHKDVMYIARYLAGLEPESLDPPTVLVGDVVGVAGVPEGDGVVNLMDALYIARYGAVFEIEP